MKRLISDTASSKVTDNLGKPKKKFAIPGGNIMKKDLGLCCKMFTLFCKTLKKSIVLIICFKLEIN